MFGLFKKKDTGPTYTNKVWIDIPQRNKAFATAVQTALSENKNVVLLHFFKDTVHTIEDVLKRNHVDVESSNLHIFNVRDAESSMSTRGTVARQLKGDCVIYMIEHFPILTAESGIMKAILDQASAAVIPVFYVALDDPLMRLFGSERIQEIMGRMGYKEGECIEHKMISKSIVRAQAKLEESIPNPIDTDSEEDWYRTNAEKYNG